MLHPRVITPSPALNLPNLERYAVFVMCDSKPLQLSLCVMRAITMRIQLLLLWLPLVCCSVVSGRNCGGGDNCTCLPDSTLPQFHLTGLAGGAHDVNAILRWRGLTHIFHQRNGGWGHVASDDLLHWQRLPDALTGGAWDGGLSVLPDADGTPTPTILFDCTSVANCLPPTAATASVHSGDGATVGDSPIIGVARAANASDPLLLAWNKSATNPLAFDTATRSLSNYCFSLTFSRPNFLPLDKQ